MNKKELIKHLRDKGIPCNGTMNKDHLEALLKDSVSSESVNIEEVKTVRLYGNLQSVIDIPEEKLQAHLDAGWRLEQ